MKTMLNLKEIAEELGMSPRNARRWTREHEFEPIDVCVSEAKGRKRLRWSAKAFTALLDTLQAEQAAPARTIIRRRPDSMRILGRTPKEVMAELGRM